MKNRSLSPFFFYLLSALFFVVDIAAFSFFERPFLYSLLCFYIAQLAYPIGLTRIIPTCFLLSLYPLIFYDRFGLNLIYLIPASFLGTKIRHVFYDTQWHYLLLLIACLLTEIGIIEYALLGLSISLTYTFLVLFVNIIVLCCMIFCKKLK